LRKVGIKKIVEIPTRPQTRICMTAHSLCLVQALQWKVTVLNQNFVWGQTSTLKRGWIYQRGYQNL
jgi:hypothetical protein